VDGVGGDLQEVEEREHLEEQRGAAGDVERQRDEEGPAPQGRAAVLADEAEPAHHATEDAPLHLGQDHGGQPHAAQHREDDEDGHPDDQRSGELDEGDGERSGSGEEDEPEIVLMTLSLTTACVARSSGTKLERCMIL
jgi:hypothetical protein